ncbi:hypothetical protein CYMTET_15389 [Cymbomonas tetramitiformis]|uniref:Uncharacterized protein n=1 Tax=Cymbomonas tetramitiformis TaxID=36881 RepID=A0AAE0L926_9CHLO|nr:hypothetical protein CYMTET_15389 [Cymbomonas tetramitiformis]
MYRPPLVAPPALRETQTTRALDQAASPHHGSAGPGMVDNFALRQLRFGVAERTVLKTHLSVKLPKSWALTLRHGGELSVTLEASNDALFLIEEHIDSHRDSDSDSHRESDSDSSADSSPCVWEIQFADIHAYRYSDDESWPLSGSGFCIGPRLPFPLLPPHKYLHLKAEASRNQQSVGLNVETVENGTPQDFRICLQDPSEQKGGIDVFGRQKQQAWEETLIDLLVSCCTRREAQDSAPLNLVALIESETVFDSPSYSKSWLGDTTFLPKELVVTKGLWDSFKEFLLVFVALFCAPLASVLLVLDLIALRKKWGGWDAVTKQRKHVSYDREYNTIISTAKRIWLEELRVEARPTTVLMTAGVFAVNRTSSGFRNLRSVATAESNTFRGYVLWCFQMLNPTFFLLGDRFSPRLNPGVGKELLKKKCHLCSRSGYLPPAANQSCARSNEAEASHVFYRAGAVFMTIFSLLITNALWGLFAFHWLGVWVPSVYMAVMHQGEVGWLAHSAEHTFFSFFALLCLVGARMWQADTRLALLHVRQNMEALKSLQLRYNTASNIQQGAGASEVPSSIERTSFSSTYLKTPTEKRRTSFTVTDDLGNEFVAGPEENDDTRVDGVGNHAFVKVDSRGNFLPCLQRTTASICLTCDRAFQDGLIKEGPCTSAYDLFLFILQKVEVLQKKKKYSRWWATLYAFACIGLHMAARLVYLFHHKASALEAIKKNSTIYCLIEVLLVLTSPIVYGIYVWILLGHGKVLMERFTLRLEYLHNVALTSQLGYTLDFSHPDTIIGWFLIRCSLQNLQDCSVHNFLTPYVGTAIVYTLLSILVFSFRWIASKDLWHYAFHLADPDAYCQRIGDRIGLPRDLDISQI